MNEVLDTLYDECGKSHRSGHLDKKKSTETVQSIATDLLQGNVIQCIPIPVHWWATNLLEILKRTFLTLTTEISFPGHTTT